MFRIILWLIIIVGTHTAVAQKLAGFWRGSMIQNGQTIDKGVPFMLEFSIAGGTIDGFSRDELYNSQHCAIKKLSGTSSGNNLNFKQTVITKKSASTKVSWCKMEVNLTYNETTGYLEGTYKSTDCRNVSGTVILYRIDSKLSMDVKQNDAHHWYNALVKDIGKGLFAPEIRRKELENFKFKPVFFDYDKHEIKPEFHPFLNEMIKIVESHSDLRVRVTGHTDADGSDEYNIDLSKRRAQAIVDYFVSKGLSKDRLVFDFKGEKEPVESNQTDEGKQRNRRVDFNFI